MEKVKKTFMGFLIFICTLIIISLLIALPIKKVSEKYLDENKIKKLVNDIDFIDIFLKENLNKESFKEIKNKLIESGLPEGLTDEFIKTTPVKKYTSDVVSKSINNALNGNDKKVVNNEETYVFLQKNIQSISSELQEKNVPYSDKLTEEKQEEFLNKVKDNIPDIETKINSLQDKITDELKKHGYTDKIDKTFLVVRFVYGTIIDIILITLIVLFILGLFILLKNSIKTFNFMGISFIISSIILMLMPKEVTKSYKYIDDLPKTFSFYIKNALNDMVRTLKNDGKVYFIIGIILIIISIIIYIIKEKRMFKELNGNIELSKIKKNNI